MTEEEKGEPAWDPERIRTGLEVQRELAQMAKALADAGGPCSKIEIPGGSVFPGETMLERFARCAPPELTTDVVQELRENRAVALLGDLFEKYGVVLRPPEDLDERQENMQWMHLEVAMRYDWAFAMIQRRQAIRHACSEDLTGGEEHAGAECGGEAENHEGEPQT